MLLGSLKLGHRLALGFGAVLALVAAIATVTCLHLAATARDAAAAARQQDAAAKADRWSLLTTLNITRALAIAKSDIAPAVDESFTPLMKATSAEITELQKDLATAITSAEGKSALADIEQQRSVYMAMRADALKRLKGHDPAAMAFVSGPLQTAADAYIAALVRLRDMEGAHAARTTDNMHGTVSGALVSVAVIAAISLGIGAAMAWLITRSVTVPLRRAVHVTATVAAGDLSQAIAVDGRDEVSEVFKALAAMQSSWREVVSRVRMSTEGVATASSQIASGSMDLSSRTEDAASSLQQAAASMEQITGNVSQSVESAKAADGLAASAAAIADKGGALVAQVVGTMQEINASSHRITDIVGVIDGIAFQTNILALNAAVEAARAGEQGRGFAVVASEVRTLAQRSALAAKEIKSLIGESVQRIESGTELAGHTGTTMDEIVASVKQVSMVVNEILTAATEQSQGLGEVNQAVAGLDQMTQRNTALVEESAAAAESLRHQAASLRELMGTFELGSPSPSRRLVPGVAMP